MLLVHQPSLNQLHQVYRVILVVCLLYQDFCKFFFEQIFWSSLVQLIYRAHLMHLILRFYVYRIPFQKALLPLPKLSMSFQYLEVHTLKDEVLDLFLLKHWVLIQPHFNVQLHQFYMDGYSKNKLLSPIFVCNFNKDDLLFFDPWDKFRQ